jgi:8-oxo-dGTP pyrophosphatase MutT (NUDIX family)
MNTFIPKSGQVDFTNIRWCPVVNCICFYGEEFLLLKRSATMRLYPGYYNGVAGFTDDHKSLYEKVFEELEEEVGLARADIISTELRGVFTQDAPEIGKTWVVHAVKVELAHSNIVTDWESESYIWTNKTEVQKLNILPGLPQVLDVVLGEPNRIVGSGI